MAKAKALRGFYDQNVEPREVAPGATFEASDETIKALQAAGLAEGGKAKSEPAPQNKAEPAPANKAEAAPKTKARK